VTLQDGKGKETGTVIVRGVNNAATLTVDSVDPNLLRRAQPVVFQSVVFNITLTDTLGGDVQPESARICLETSGGNVDDQCLGFLDESDPENPRWKCQDECLSERDDGTVCGTSSHFTSFAILLSGSVGADGCGNNSSNFFTGAYWSDSIVLAVFSISLVSFLVFGAFLLAFTKPGRRILYGKEGLRIHRLHQTSVELQNLPEV